MADLTFNKFAGAVLATGLAITGLIQLSSGVFSQEPVKKPGFAVEVAADTSAAAAAPEVPPDWGTVLPKADVAAGQATFAKCQSCHSLTANGTGPNLTGVEGRKPGTEPGFNYSPAMVAFGAKQPIWDYQHIFEFIKNPQAYISGTKMTFVGLKNPEDRINVIAFLHTQGSSLPIPAPNPAAAAKGAATTGPSPGTGPAAAAPGGTPAGAPTATGTTSGAGVAGAGAGGSATAPKGAGAGAQSGGPAGQGKGAPGGAPNQETTANPGNAGSTRK